MITFTDITSPSTFRLKVYILCYLSKRQQNEEDGVRTMNKETTLMGHVQVTLVDDTIKLQETNSTGRRQVRNTVTVKA